MRPTALQLLIGVPCAFAAGTWTPRRMPPPPPPHVPLLYPDPVEGVTSDPVESVRELLQPGGSTARADPATARLNAVARSTSRPSTRDGSLRGTSGYVPDPSVEAEKRDPWKASDEELSAARQKVQHDDDMAAIRMAAAVGAGVGVLPGFGR